MTRAQRVRMSFLVAAPAVVLLLMVGLAQAQSAISVRDLRLGFDSQYKNELVAVHGWVSAERRVTSRTFKGFYLKDRFGDFLLIRTTQPLPDINSEIDVKGVAVRDADSGDVYLTETTRDVVKNIPPEGASSGPSAVPVKPPPSAVVPEPPPAVSTSAPEGGMSSQTMILTVFGVAIVALVGAAIFLLSRKKEQPAGFAAGTSSWDGSMSGGTPTVRETAGSAATPPVFPTGPSIDDYKTVKVYKTTKVLPGKLIVLDNKQESDVIHLTDQSGKGEVEIGRDSPDVTNGIRIKDRTNTLSRRQARVAYSAGNRQFTVVNLAGDASNPTIVNGRQMGDNESVTLKDGDLLVMGNVEMKFRQK